MTSYVGFLAENGTEPQVFRDPAVGDNKNAPLHRWVSWIAGYAASFVDDVLAAYAPAGRPARILDPFCGVGTTLVQAVLHGHEAIGCEINPYPALVARAKLSAPRINLQALDEALATLERVMPTWPETRPCHEAPALFKSRLPFFSPSVERQVLHVLDFIDTLPDDSLRNLFRVAFGAVMVSVSNYTYEPSLGSRPAAGKALIDEAEVGLVLLTKLQDMRHDIAWVQKNMEGKPPGPHHVLNSNFFAAQTALPAGSIDIMVTSPPYMNNYHYVRNTRPQLYWLHFIATPRDQKYLELHNFGQFWQTVRNAPPLPLHFSYPDLEASLAALRATRHEKGPYGGPGWANYVTTYFNDCYRFMEALARLLAPGGVGVVVIGNSIIQGLDIRTERFLGGIGTFHGLTLEGIQQIRERRVGASITQSSVRQGVRSQATLSEYAVILRQR